MQKHFSDLFTFKVPVEKVVIDEEEFHGIEIDGNLNLENLSRTSVHRLRMLEYESSR